eukprot:m.179727 g.179727  ORF g.179727 m.179727 type:complete len:563 (+) comp14841_c0_seq1:250-1938(+)
MRRTQHACAAVTLAVAAAIGVGATTNQEDLTYSRIHFRSSESNGSATTVEQMSGVYALYSKPASVSGVLVIANPLDGCRVTTLPPGVDETQPFVLLTRLDSSSQCSPLEQADYASQAGAAGVINMAPTRSSFIYLLEKRESESNSPDATIPQVAISGSSGYRLLTAALNNPGGRVSIQGPGGYNNDESTLDFIVAIVCMIVALFVLGYAFRVGRTLCLQPPAFVPPEESVQDVEERKRQIKQLLNTLPVKPYDGADDEENVCSICLEQFEQQEEVRILRCDHYFHVDCIDPWLLSRANCPLCKDDVLSGVVLNDVPVADTHAGPTEPTAQTANHSARVAAPAGGAGASTTGTSRRVSYMDAQRGDVVEIELGMMDSAGGRGDANAIYLPPVRTTMLPAISASSLDEVSEKPPLSSRPSNDSLVGMDNNSRPTHAHHRRLQRDDRLAQTSSEVLPLMQPPKYDLACAYDVAVGAHHAHAAAAEGAGSVAYDNMTAEGELQYDAAGAREERESARSRMEAATTQGKKGPLSRLQQQTITQWNEGIYAIPASNSNSTLESMQSIV